MDSEIKHRKPHQDIRPPSSKGAEAALPGAGQGGHLRAHRQGRSGGLSPPGWGCEQVISHHLDVYGLSDHINPIKASCAAAMADTLARRKTGEPVFFYTWAPNWTIFKLKPGEDVLWINVPEILPAPSRKAGVERMTVTGVEGAVSEPVKLGFVVSDIQVVANSEFLKKNPPIRRFFEVFSLPLADINEQNTRMQDGEDSARDIERHVDAWIERNRTTWDGWLQEARSAASL